MLIELTLLLTLARAPQTNPPTLPPDHFVALVFSDTRTETMRLDDAMVIYGWLEEMKTRSEADERLHAALVVALGTLPDAERLTVPGLPGTRDRADWEVRRGVRRPTQKPEDNQ